MRTLSLAACICTVQAGSATWNSNPTDSLWNNSANWTPATVPYGGSDVATFGASNVTDVTLGVTPNGDAGNILAGVVFQPSASAYKLTMTAVQGKVSWVEFDGDGIINNSGITQNLVAANAGGAFIDSARIYFLNSASAGDDVVITNQGSASSQILYGAFTAFWTGSGPSAGRATIINEGCTASGTIFGGNTSLLFSSRADSATFINNPGTVSGAAAGDTLIQTVGDLGTSTFINNAATVPGAEGGWTEFDYGITSGASFIANGASLAGCQGGQVYAFGAGYQTGEGLASYTANGGNGNNAEGGLIDIRNLPANINTIVVAKGGKSGGLGGTILIEDLPDIPLPQFQVLGNGTLDLANASGTIAIGSLAGSGIVLLDGHDLSVGSNNLSTTFSGSIEEDGTLVKAGTGTLTLTGANTQTGGTTINAGVLIASNRNGSATGTGRVNVKAGTLGGKGIITGAVIVGTGSGNGAFLAPSTGSHQLATLTLKKTLTCKADATYTCTINTNNVKADQVIANGVTVESGAQFGLVPVANKRLTNGTVFTIISNTAGTPINGAFINLPDGSTLTAGRNKYQATYSGGDGNDLTLTVVP